MEKHPLGGNSDDEPPNNNQADPFGEGKIQEHSPDKENIYEDYKGNNEDGDGTIEDLEPLPITILRRFFPPR